MHFVFAFFRYYPVLAIGLIAVSLQIVLFYRRRGSKMQYYWIAASTIFAVGLVFWIALRGDLNSDQWVRYIFGV